MSNLTRFGRGGSLFEELFRDVSPGYFVRPLHGDALPERIKVDVKENGNAYTVQAEIPGVKKEDIHVDVEGSVVTVRAEIRQQDEQVKDNQVLHSERYFGEVARSLQLPAEVDQQAAVAKYDNGVLTLTLPKKLQKSAQRLTIN